MGNWSGAAPGNQHPVKHGLGFLLSGTLAFTIDAVILMALNRLGLHPIVARVFSISVSMIVGWMAHRRFTFRLTYPPSLSEFLRYAAVQWTVAAINYGIFVLIILLRPSIAPFYALFASSVVAMVFSYLGMRFAAFRTFGGSRE